MLTYPTPQVKTSHNQAMLWQALDRVHWRLVGSYGHTPGPDGRVDNGAQPRLIPALLDVCTTGATAPTLTPRLARAVRAELAAWRVTLWEGDKQLAAQQSFLWSSVEEGAAGTSR